MALGNFGIKEVADVRFYPAGAIVYSAGAEGSGAFSFSAGYSAADKVLEFTTLKVSNLEFTAEQTEARGGKGNPPLIIWDYGRECNVNIEDALLSADCMKALFGNSKDEKNITVSAEKFPGNYSVIGITYARNQTDGKDHLFTFYVPNAKVNSEITLSMEAEGDPTVFAMNLRALRTSASDSTMVALVPFADEYTATTGQSIFVPVLGG